MVTQEAVWLLTDEQAATATLRIWEEQFHHVGEYSDPHVGRRHSSVPCPA